MIQTTAGQTERFNNAVGIKFQLYNSLFLSLPFYGIDRTGILLSLFSSECEDGLANGRSPIEIVERFSANRRDTDPVDLLFRFVQYVERQVVLFDALEDAAFAEINDLSGSGTLAQLEGAAQQNNKLDEFRRRIDEFSVRLVLTAHPTQFYPGSVLGIINDLDTAIRANDVSTINTLLKQLGRTPFFKKQKPTPFDEAQSLVWYLENVFYDAVGEIAAEMRRAFGDQTDLSRFVRMGFWSGGDRDGNPFVTVETTLKTADSLRRAILRSYYRDVRRLKRRLTFADVETLVADLEDRLYKHAFTEVESEISRESLREDLADIRTRIVNDHNGLFVRLVDELIDKVEIFGLFFASLDIRQEASEHGKILDEIASRGSSLSAGYTELTDAEKVDSIFRIETPADVKDLESPLAIDTINTVAAAADIQTRNGPEGCHRYIISQCQSELHVIEVIGLFLLGGWRLDELTVDIVPLFETIADLQNAPAIMQALYARPEYRRHLERRGNRQTIMLGFSDGTKDGGYLMANWSIYKAKEELTKASQAAGVEVVFFDGRGGPPARGGGKTHRFYSSMGRDIAGDSIELTVQGQTVSSNFGTVTAARYNIEQLLHAGVYNDIFGGPSTTFTPDEESLMRELAEHSFAAYDELKNHPQFLDYLSATSPLNYYAQTNIGSRPAKRGTAKLTLKDLRAIPFVGAWSQIKLNVPGFYGVGTALERMAGRRDEIAAMYASNRYFKALIDNCEMAMQKTNLALTAFLENDPEHGVIWRKIRDEHDLTRRNLSAISGNTDLMSEFPVEQESVKTRERIVVPLLVIQQYALARLRSAELSPDDRATLEKLVIRCSFGIINAGRNSA